VVPFYMGAAATTASQASTNHRARTRTRHASFAQQEGAKGAQVQLAQASARGARPAPTVCPTAATATSVRLGNIHRVLAARVQARARCVQLANTTRMTAQAVGHAHMARVQWQGQRALLIAYGYARVANICLGAAATTASQASTNHRARTRPRPASSVQQEDAKGAQVQLAQASARGARPAPMISLTAATATSVRLGNTDKAVAARVRVRAHSALLASTAFLTKQTVTRAHLARHQRQGQRACPIAKCYPAGVVPICLGATATTARQENTNHRARTRTRPASSVRLGDTPKQVAAHASHA
jgi:hypothetical protein